MIVLSITLIRDLPAAVRGEHETPFIIGVLGIGIERRFAFGEGLEIHMEYRALCVFAAAFEPVYELEFGFAERRVAA